MLTQFHEQAQKAIVIAESIAFDLGHSHVGSEHLLLSLLKMKDILMTKMLKSYHVDDEVIYKDIVRLFGEKDIQPFYMEYSDIVKKILEEAINITCERKESKVSLNILCLALLSQKESVAVELLNKYHVSFDQIKEELSQTRSLLYELDKIHELVNFNELVKKENRLMIGRDQELEQLFLTLCKKEKNNVLLIGKAGVGKTALVEKLAYKINYKEVPKLLQNKVIYELSLSSIVAGTKYRGEFEEKFKKIIDKVIQAKDAILFIDEIHRLNKVVEEILYPAMEDFYVDVVIGKEASTRSIRIDLPPFTLVGATTRAGDLSAPLRDRFGIVSKLEYYNVEELTSIINRTSQVYHIEMDDEAKIELAKRSRGTPRIANRLFRRVRDFAQYNGDDVITKERTVEALQSLKVDELGLDDVDHKYLLGIIQRFRGGPVGLEAIAASIGEEPLTLEDVYEPYLLQTGLIKRTPRGRVVTELAYQHFHILKES